MPITVTLPWDLPDVRVVASQLLKDATLLIQVASTLRTAPGHRCGREIDRFHGFDRPSRLRHLLGFGRAVLLEIQPKRYRCPYCEGGPTRTQRCAWYAPNRPHTTAFEQDGLKRLIHGTVADVSRPLELGVKAVEGIIDHRLAPAVDWPAFTAVETVGIDEVAVCQGQGHYVAVVWARDAAGTTHVLAVWPARLQATVQSLLETVPSALTGTIRRVCIDLGAGDAGAGATALPQAHLVGDRFHVAIQYREAVDELRKPEFRRRNAGRPANQTRPTAAWRPLLRREWLSLTPAQQGQLVELVEQTPTLASAYLLRNTLTAIFDCTPERATAQTRLQRWTEQAKASGRHCFDKCLHPLHTWQDGLLNYFQGRHTSGFVEGLNNKRTLLKRRCVGLADPGERVRRLWLDIEGPRLWA